MHIFTNHPTAILHFFDRSDSQIIWSTAGSPFNGLGSGKIYGKTSPDHMVSWRFSLQPIHWSWDSRWFPVIPGRPLVTFHVRPKSYRGSRVKICGQLDGNLVEVSETQLQQLLQNANMTWFMILLYVSVGEKHPESMQFGLSIVIIHQSMHQRLGD